MTAHRFLFRRRALRVAIGVLAVIQVAILGYLAALLVPEADQLPSAPRPAQERFWLPSAATVAASGRPTMAAARTVGPLVPASDYVRLAGAFDPEQALEHLAVLASSDLGGRQAGSPEGRAAADYIAGRFAEYGLQPALGVTYFQTFTVPYGRFTSLPTLGILGPGGGVLTQSYAYRTDYRALGGGYVGAGQAEGAVVWLNRCSREDFLGQDLVGKVVLCLYRGDDQVYRSAIEHGVAGLLLVDRDSGPHLSGRRGAYRDTAWVPQTIPAYLVSEKVTQDLLAGTEYTLDDLTLRFGATTLSTTVRMAVTVQEIEASEARNVLGLLPGADPQQRNQLVILGAHYDHLGREPDGAVMAGANDNASGVAVLLEIARLWQAQGFHPARSVLFAAWDAEELGLLGSQHYVSNPLRSLTETVAVLNLDMVGRGETLQVDGTGVAAAQLEASAGVYGLTVTVSSLGRSDHASFYEAGVPAGMLIWWPDRLYHTPDDQPQAIELDHLRAAGLIAAHALAALADGQVEVERAVERWRGAVLSGDREAFLQGLDPADPNLRSAQSAWFDSVQSRGPDALDVDLLEVSLGDGQADAAVRMTFRWTDASRPDPPVILDMRFTRRAGAWAFSGYDLESAAGEAVAVERFADVPAAAGDLLSATEQAYLSVTRDLGVSPVPGTRFIYYPSAALLRAVACPGVGGEVTWLVTSPRVVQLAWGQAVTPAVASLVLEQMGLPSGAAPWLREGLGTYFTEGAAREYLPLLGSAQTLPSLTELSHLSEPSAADSPLRRAVGWAMTEYLLKRYGTSGLRSLCAAWDRSGEQASAFKQGLGVWPGEFEQAWRTQWLAPLREADQAIRGTLVQRAQAVLRADAEAFLTTLTAADPVLETEERAWFAGLSDRLPISYTLDGRLVAWSPETSQATVALTARMLVSPTRETRVDYEARFVREGERWVYAGMDWSQSASQHFVLKFQQRDPAWVQRVLRLAEDVYAQLTADLGGEPPQPQEIKVYSDAEVFRASVAASLPDWVTGWTEPGEAIKVWLPEDSDPALQQVIAHELAHQVLFTLGLRDSWLQEGIATYESGRVLPLGQHWMAGRYAPVVQEAVHRRRDLSLEALPSFEELPEEEVGLAYAQSWSVVSFVAEEYGMEGLRRLVAQAVAGGSLARGLSTGLGLSVEEFQSRWREYASTAGVPESLLALAQRFEAGRALAHIAYLSGPECAGREAGTAGAERAAAYIAEEFARLGLVPAGDPVAGTQGSGYFQLFPISYTHLLTTPSLSLLGAEGQPVRPFVYGQDFAVVYGQGVAEGELVWLRSGDLEGMRFGGAVVLERGVSDPEGRARLLQEHGARGLILVRDRKPEDLETHPAGCLAWGSGIPVFEITEAAFEVLLEHVGRGVGDLAGSPPALPLGVHARQAVLCSPVTTTLTANVVGMLPGSDPRLADEVLVVGAHYDHRGNAPSGGYFSGANWNASGVATMLEMVRLWQAQGYRPARTLLLVAWGAQEQEGAGVAHYLSDPLVPLTSTVGAIALQGVAGGEGYRLLFYGARDRDLPLIHSVDAAAARLGRRAWRMGSTGQGWHVGFSRAGVPTVEFIWDKAEESAYTMMDTLARIDRERLAASGEVVTLAVSWLAGR